MQTFLFLITLIALFMLLANFLLPFCLRLGAVFGGKKRPVRSAGIKKVSVIIPVFNEEDHISERLVNVQESLAEFDRPYEVLIGSDGSTDKTAEVVKGFIWEHGFKNWKFFAFPKEGKGPTINKLVRQSRGDLIVSTDADVAMDRDAVGRIVRNFEDDGRLGCLSSVPTYSHEKKNSQSFYWAVEMKIRAAESRLGCLIVVTGWPYAFRRDAFAEIPSAAMADDLWIPLTTLLKGFRCRQDERLRALAERTDEATEVRRRERVISGGVDIVRRLSGELLKRRGLFLIVFFHKINRWLLPFWLFLLILSSGVLDVRLLIVYPAALIPAAAVAGPRRLFYFLGSALTPVLSVLQMRGKKDLSKWEHTRAK